MPGVSSVVIVVKEVIGVKVICFVGSHHNFLYRGLSSVVIVVKEVIVVKVICFVASFHNFLYRRICAPPELNIKICNLITSYVALPYIFNANLCIRFFITHFVRQRYF